MKPNAMVNPWDDPSYNPNPPGAPADPAGAGVPPASGTGQPAPTPAPAGSVTRAPADANPINVTAQSPSAAPGMTEPPAPTVLPDGNGGSVPVPPAALAPWNQGSFTADSNVINSQVNPGSDPRTAKLQELQDTQLGKMTNGPDRNAIARDQYATWEGETAPGFEHSITDATNAAAAHGQIRSGQLTNQYGDLARQRVLDQTTARNKYMSTALENSIGDTRAAYGATADAANTAYGQGASARTEQRGERDYQRSLAEQAIARRIQQQQAESGADQTNFDNSLTRWKAGNTGDPTGALEGASAQASGESQQSSSDMAALIRAWLARNQQAA